MEDLLFTLFFFVSKHDMISTYLTMAVRESRCYHQVMVIPKLGSMRCCDVVQGLIFFNLLQLFNYCKLSDHFNLRILQTSCAFSSFEIMMVTYS